MITFLCNIDTKAYKNKAQAQKETGNIVNRTKCKERIMQMTADTLSKAITQGYSFTTAALNGTAEKNFVSQMLAITDIDNEADIIKAENLSEEFKKRKKTEKTLDEAYKILEARGIEKTPIMNVPEAISILEANNITYSFIYYSFSHSTWLPKFRIVCVLDKIITDPDEARRLNQYLISLFPQADQSCFNLDRFYYGTDKGLAGEIYDRSTKIIISDEWGKSEPEQPSNERTGADKEYTPPKNEQDEGTDFDYKREKDLFDLLSYVQYTTGQQGTQKGKEIHFEICPICGHKDDFRVNIEKNVYKCFSAANNKGGNIINYLMETRKIDLKAAREYFIYDIMKQDRQKQKEAYKKVKNARQKRTGENQMDNISSKPQGKAYKYNFIKINPFETPEVRNRYGWNDIGMGYLFADAYKNISRYVLEAKAWYVYDGRVWKADLNSSVAAQQARDLMDYLLDCRHLIDNDETREKWIDFISKRLKKTARDTMIADALSVYPVSIQDFDKDPYIFNCQNCTLNLKDFTQHKHRPDDFLSKISNVVYDPAAKCDRWERFISEIMREDMETARFVQKALGYALTGDTSEECFFILYGSTSRNGKGTTMETTLHIMGDYGHTAEPETITQKQNSNAGNSSEDIAGLKGARFVNISEPDKGIRLNNALVKRVTGGDSIRARFLFQNSFEFRPQFKLFINTNHLPRVSDDTVFKSERVKLIPFERHFPENEQDKGLKASFKQPENISGIFNWFIEGLKLMRNEGMKQPQAVKAATDQYREDSDTIGVFIRECLIEAKNSSVTLKEVYSEYLKWCENNGYKELNNKNLSMELRRKRLKVEVGHANLLRLYDYNLLADLPEEWRKEQDLPI